MDSAYAFITEYLQFPNIYHSLEFRGLLLVILMLIKVNQFANKNCNVIE